MTSSIYERDEGPAGCCASACPTSSSRSTTSTAGSRCSRPRASASPTASTSGWTSVAAELRERHDAVVLAIGSRVHRTLDVPGADLAGRALRDGLPLRAQPLGRARGRRGRRSRAHGGRQARRRDRRRRHGDGLRRQRDTASGAKSVTVLDTYPAPPGPAARDSVPWPAGAAAAREHLCARRGRRAALDPDRDASRWPRRPRRRGARHICHAAARPGAGARHRVRAAGRPRPDRDRVLAS